MSTMTIARRRPTRLVRRLGDVQGLPAGARLSVPSALCEPQTRFAPSSWGFLLTVVTRQYYSAGGTRLLAIELDA